MRSPLLSSRGPLVAGGAAFVVAPLREAWGRVGSRTTAALVRSGEPTAQPNLPSQVAGKMCVVLASSYTEEMGIYVPGLGEQ